MSGRPPQNSKIHFRSLSPPDDDEDEYSPHFLAALQVVAHILSPIRKGLIHFYLMYQTSSLEKVEWKTLHALGKILKELVARSPRSSSAASADDMTANSSQNSEEDPEEIMVPVDPTGFYVVLLKCLKLFKKNTQPRDATEALQILLDILQRCCRTLPITSHLWTALLDSAGLGLVARQVIVGKSELEDEGEILQRTRKESMIEWCPLVLKRRTTLDEALQEHCSRRPYIYDFDKEPYDFEVRIPLLAPLPNNINDVTWLTTKSIQWSSLTTYLFLAIDRLDKLGKFHAEEMDIPKILNVSKICENSAKGAKQYELVGSILHDEDDYVAVLRNPFVSDPEEEGAWKLMESEEVIPLTEGDVFDFVKGEGEGGPCGTVLVYKLCDEERHKELNQILSDIIIAHVSGKLDSNNSEYYYEEEVIDDE